MKLLTVNLQQEAILYLAGTMGYFGHTLSKVVVNSISLTKGRCFTIIPSGTPETHWYKFRTGGLYWDDCRGKTVMPVQNDSTVIVEDMIARFFGASATHCAVAEDISSRLGDTGMDKTMTPYLVFGEEIYDFNSNHDNASEVALTLRRSNTSYYSFFALLSMDIEQQQRFGHPKCHITDEDLALLASTICGIIQFAYDGESYLIWDKDGTLQRYAEESLDKNLE